MIELERRLNKNTRDSISDSEDEDSDDSSMMINYNINIYDQQIKSHIEKINILKL